MPSSNSNEGQLSKKRTLSQQGEGDGTGESGPVSLCKVGRLEAPAAADENQPPASRVQVSKRVKWTREAYQKLTAAAADGRADEVQQLLQQFSFPKDARAFCLPLRSASASGHTQVVQLLVAAKCDVEHSSLFIAASLADASKNGHTAAVQALLDAAVVSGESARQRDSRFLKLLVTSACEGQLEAVRVLVSAGADVNHSDTSEQTPLMVAASNGEVQIVQFLVGAKANLDAADNVDMTAIDHAASNGHVGVVKALIAAKVSINECGKRRVWPILTAAENGQLETVEFLIAAKADIAVSDRDYMSAVELAMTRGHAQVAQSLLQAKASLDEEECSNLLHTVAHNGHADLVDLLLHLNADPTGSLPSAVLGASHGGGHEGVRCLLEAKADPNHPCAPHSFFAEPGHQLSCLYIAAAHGQEEVARLLIDAKADLDRENSGGDFPLYGAARVGASGIVKMLVDSKADVNKAACDVSAPKEIAREFTSGSDTFTVHMGSSHKPLPTEVMVGFTPLYAAAQGKHGSAVAALLQAKACPDACGFLGRTPLFVAAQFGDVSVIDMLLVAKADPNRPSACAAQGQRTHLMSPLLAALCCASLGGAEVLLKAKATLDGFAPHVLDLARERFESPEETDGCPLLIFAVQDGFERVVDLLLDLGVDINRPDSDSFTPVFVAVQERNETILRTLLQRGADPCKRKTTGTFPLYLAAQVGFAAGIRLLCDAKANPHLGKEPDSQPIQIAFQNRRDAAVGALLEAKADPNAIGNSAPILSEASRLGNLELVKDLLHHKADPNKKNSDSATPIFYGSAHHAVLQALLAANADPNVRSSLRGTTAMYHAGDHKCVRVLCDAKANPNATFGEDGETALHLFSEQGDARKVEVLIQAKADVEARTRQGQTAAAVAAAHKEVLQVLLAAKANVDERK